jgi:hypothetical protein
MSFKRQASYSQQKWTPGAIEIVNIMVYMIENRCVRYENYELQHTGS